MLRNLTKDEIIEGYRNALKKYADDSNWKGSFFTLDEDINHDDCSGLYCHNGEIARGALQNYNENSRVTYASKTNQEERQG